MNESEPIKPDVASYENQVRKSYSEFGQEGLDVGHWGTMINKFSGERFNGYTDKEHINKTFVSPILFWLSDNLVQNQQIKIADFGGDDGFLLNEVATGIRNDRQDLGIKGFVVDIDSTGKARIKFEKEKKEGHRQEIEYVLADITQTGLNESSLDVIISRMTTQYLDEGQQKRFLDEALRVLKENGLLIIETIADYTGNKEYNRFWSEITKVISGGSDFKRKFPAFGEFSNYLKTFKEHQLETKFGSRYVDFPFSIQAFTDRFNLNDEQVKELNKLYEQEAKTFPDMFTREDGVLCLKASLIELRFSKNTTGQLSFKKKK
jgi:ubiquinone/menaquinone biosynthesis C-methylase UbiE